MFINDEPNQSARQRHVKGYSQVHSLGHPMQGHPMQGHPMQGHPMHPQEYPNHPNYAAMEDDPEFDTYDPDLSDDELYDASSGSNNEDKTVWEKVKDFFKSTAGIVTLVVILAIIVALMMWYFSRAKGYKFLYY